MEEVFFCDQWREGSTFFFLRVYKKNSLATAGRLSESVEWSIVLIKVKVKEKGEEDMLLLYL